MLKGRKANTGLIKGILKCNKNASLSLKNFLNSLDLKAIELRKFLIFQKNKFFQNVKALARKRLYSKQVPSFSEGRVKIGHG